ncbi:hypothetical protein ABEV00_26230 [Paenibacillus thiaminolyticus]|uniref:hypothetical protein n=1 Tax=Paenibacillus thiaminolyticus TaxID=49283 RepID=UPI003D2E4083
MIELSEGLVLLLVLRLRHELKQNPKIDDVKRYIKDITKNNFAYYDFQQILMDLERKAHIKVKNKKIQISMSFIYYYTEILQPGDEDLDTIEYIERRKIEIEKQKRDM